MTRGVLGGVNSLLYTENSRGGIGGDQFSKVSRVQGIYEATEQTMPISAVTTESPSPVANINTALWGDCMLLENSLVNSDLRDYFTWSECT